MLGAAARHLKHNLVAYMALFVALGGTSAYAANTVFSADIADGEVKTVDLANNAVTTGKVTDGTIAWEDLGMSSVTSSRIKDASVFAHDLGDGAITTPKLLDAAVTNPKLADDAVTTAKVQDGTLTGSDLAPGAATAGVGVAKLNPQNCLPGSPAFCGINNPRLFTGAVRVSPNVYCLTPAAGSGLDPVTRPGVVTVDGFSTLAPAGNASAFIMTVNGICSDGRYEVHTERIPAAGGAAAAATNVGFVITVP